MKRKIMALLCVLSTVLCLCGCSGKQDDGSIIGKWTVTAYEVNGEKCSKDEMRDMFGENFFDYYESPVLLFQKSGYVCMYKESDKDEEYTIKYTITDDTIELYDDEQGHFLYLEKVDDTIRCNLDSQAFDLIYTKER